MNDSSFSLGAALAFITSGVEVKQFSHVLTEGDVAFIEQVQGKIDSLDGVEKITAVPHAACRIGASVLKSDETLLLELFAGKYSGENCNQLAKHLNDCLDCLSIFAQLLRDFDTAIREHRLPQGDSYER